MYPYSSCRFGMHDIYPLVFRSHTYALFFLLSTWMRIWWHPFSLTWRVPTRQTPARRWYLFRWQTLQHQQDLIPSYPWEESVSRSHRPMKQEVSNLDFSSLTKLFLFKWHHTCWPYLLLNNISCNLQLNQRGWHFILCRQFMRACSWRWNLPHNFYLSFR